MTTNSDLIKADDVENNWILAKGKKELLKHLRGERLTSTEAIKARCYECMGGYGDNKVDCMISACPLHPMMPYSPNRNKAARIMSDEQRKAIGERFAKIRSERSLENQI